MMQPRSDLAALVADHDWDQDSHTIFGMSSCPHWDEWASLLHQGQMNHYASRTPVQTDQSASLALDLLGSSGVPETWIDLAGEILHILDSDLRYDAIACLRGAMEGHFVALLATARHDQASTSRLVYSFEASGCLDDWMFNLLPEESVTAANFIPHLGIDTWIRQYLDIVNQHGCKSMLRELSRRTQSFMCPTEALSRFADPDLLLDPQLWPKELATEAPNLPSGWINEQLMGRTMWAPDVVFHPNAHADAAWGFLLHLLEGDEAEWVGRLLSPFNNIRDDGWSGIMGYNMHGANLGVLIPRLRKWCAHHPDDAEELEDYI